MNRGKFERPHYQVMLMNSDIDQGLLAKKANGLTTTKLIHFVLFETLSLFFCISFCYFETHRYLRSCRTWTYFAFAPKSSAYRTSITMSRKIKLEQINIESAEDFDEHVLAASADRLVVLDIYKGWSGPCEIIRPTFEYLLINIDDGVKLLQFITIDQDNMTKFMPNANVVPENQGCRPLFALIKDEKVQKVIEGCNAPLIIQSVTGVLDVEI